MTEIFVPTALFPAGSNIEVAGHGVTWHRDPAASTPRLPGRECHDHSPEGHRAGRSGRLATGTGDTRARRRAD